MREISFLLAVFGIAYTVGHSRLTLGIRTILARFRFVATLVEFFECPACSSFHYGWALYVVGVSPFHSWWVSAFACTAASFILGRMTGLISDPQKE